MLRGSLAKVKNSTQLIVGLIVLVFLGISCVVLVLSSSFLSLGKDRSEFLTQQHEQEVSMIVKQFELAWGSLEAYLDPSTRQGLVITGYFDSQIGSLDQKALFSEEFGVVYENIEINHIRILNYTPQQIKLVACIQVTGSYVRPDRSVIISFSNIEQCAIYVFYQQDSQWKLAGKLDTTVPDNVGRDWDLASRELKEIIGTLPKDPGMIDERFGN